MKISKQDKLKNRQKIVESAVKLIQQNGYQAISIREIGIDAGLSHVVYNYFSSKEEILYAYFEIIMLQSRENVESGPSFAGLQFREKLQSFFENRFSLMEPNRDFVKLSFDKIFIYDWVDAGHYGQHSEDEFNLMLDEWMQTAVSNGEFPDPPLHDFVYKLLWDYQLGITLYWLNDSSDNHESSRDMLNISLDLVATSLNNNLIGKAIDLAHFYIRQHLLSPLANGIIPYKQTR